MFIAFLLGGLQANRRLLYFSFVLVNLWTNFMLPFGFLTEIRFLTLELFDLGFQLLNSFSSLSFLALRNFNVFLHWLEYNFGFSPGFRKLLFFGLILLIKEGDTPYKSFIVLNFNLNFSSPLNLVITVFQQFGPIAFDFLKLANNVQQILACAGRFFF